MAGIIFHLIKRSIHMPFALKGRRNRIDYISYQILVIALVGSVWLLDQFLETIGAPGIIQWLFLWPALVVYLGAAVSLLTVGAQRCRDIGWPGWFIFFCFIPLAGHVFWVLLLLMPGTGGENRYGMPPGYDSQNGFLA